MKEHGYSIITAEKILMGIESPYTFISVPAEFLVETGLNALVDVIGYDPKEEENIKTATWLGAKAVGYEVAALAGAAVGGPPGALGAVVLKAAVDGIGSLCSYLF